MAHKFTTSYLEDSVSLFRYYKKLAEGAIEQVTDEKLFAVLDPEMNSIALIVKHNGRQHAVALDRLSYQRWRKANPES